MKNPNKGNNNKKTKRDRDNNNKPTIIIMAETTITIIPRTARPSITTIMVREQTKVELGVTRRDIVGHTV